MDSVPFVAYLKNGKRFYRWYDWLTWDEIQKLYGGTTNAEIMCDKKTCGCRFNPEDPDGETQYFVQVGLT